MLFTKESIEPSALESWKRDAVEKFTTKLADKKHVFPCIPATIGNQLNQFRYGFVTNPSDISSTEELGKMLEEYSTNYRNFGNYTSLIIFYEKFNESFNVEQYEQFFWEQLNRLSVMDYKAWPHHIPTDPRNPLWEFCYHGEQYFMYCATPSHKMRMSRHFPYFMLAITPRSVLVDFYSSAIHADKIKSQIRNRLTDYDSIEIHPDLNSYGKEDNFEWKQYFLHDDQTTISHCPFHSKSSNKKN